MKVLYIACNPDGAADLALEREITDLQRKALQYSGDAAQFNFLPSLSVEELPTALSTYAPDVLHLSAHGEDGVLHMANAAGKRVAITANMLKAFLTYERHPPKLLYLNACNSSQMAADLVNLGVVQMAVGTTAPITNRAARAAAVVFYDRILMGSTVSDAFAAGQQLMEALQEMAVSSNLYVGFANSELAGTRLYSTPRLVAKPRDNKYVCTRDGRIILELQLIGCPNNTSQVIFFTDDKQFVQGEMTAEESDATFLARQLCRVVRVSPKRGRIDSPDTWETDDDFPVYACGTTADGRSFSVASTICEAILDYAKYVNRQLLSAPKGAALARVVYRLQDPDRAALEPATSSVHEVRLSNLTEENKPARRDKVKAETKDTTFQQPVGKQSSSTNIAKPRKGQSEIISPRTRKIRALAFKNTKP